MAIIRDMRERIEALEERECSGRSGWSDAAPWVAFWIAVGIALAASDIRRGMQGPEPVRPNPSVECIKAGGEWSWNACRKVQPK